MKIKVLIHILPNGQGKNDKSREVTKPIEIDENSEQINMGEIIQMFDDKLKKELDNRMVAYYNHRQQVFINIGNYWYERPVITLKEVQDAKIAVLNIHGDLISEVDPQGTEKGYGIELKFRERAKGEHSDALMMGQAEMSKGSRRTKERKIGEVILAVKKWRELYTLGEKAVDGQMNPLSLEDAAKKVGISKKSLDDYFLQLKNGQRNGFNFNEHKNDKIGILRAYNKKNKKGDMAGPKGKKAK